jgi:autotransporter-associated beta strand protein
VCAPDWPIYSRWRFWLLPLVAIYLVIHFCVAAFAQDATWTGVTSNDWNTGSNWSTGSVPTGTATFGQSNRTQITFSFPAITNVGNLNVQNGAPNYTFSLFGQSINFNTSGIGGQSSSVTITNNFLPPNEGSQTGFRNSSSAGSATIVNTSSGGETVFYDASTAGSATIINSAGDGTVPHNGGHTLFIGTSTAANAIINNGANGVLAFEDASTAGNAIITTDSGALLRFNTASSGGFARLITNAGGIVDISGLGAAMTVGSIEGAGSYFLGSKTLTVGLNNLSTEVSGVISDGGPTSGGKGGSLIKTGTGTLILSGANAYTGGTTINAGTLQLGNGGTTGSIMGNVVNNSTFAINRSDTFTFSGVISGSGAFQQMGSGTTILTANNSYTGTTTVNAGTLIVNGVIANSAVTDDLFMNEGARIITLAAAHRLPAIYRLGYQAGEGGLLAYGPNIPEMYRRAAYYVDRIFRGAKPSDLPIEQPTRIELVVNLRTAEALGLEVPPTLLARADEVIG